MQAFLGGITFEDAANWMDSMRSNADYDFMKPWHYLDFDSGQVYSRPPTDDNIITRLSLAFSDLQYYRLVCDGQVKTDLLYLFHLIGDLHQPLHVGYGSDKGGNMLTVDFMHTHTNLHKLWDELIIDSNRINADSCLTYLEGISPQQLRGIRDINFVTWYNESRKLLTNVYDYPEFIITDKYVNKNKVVIEQRLLYAGIRLAAILDTLFNAPAPAIAPSPLPNSISAEQAQNYFDKKVTVCTKVYSIKSLDNVSFMDVGAAFPKSPLTLVIFKKDRDAFKPSLEELYKGKYICVKGMVVKYHDKPEIIVTNPEDIIIR